MSTFGSCGYYSTTTYDTCSFSACPGDTISVDGCTHCTGQQEFTLYSGNTTQLAQNFGGCGDSTASTNICSTLVYIVPDTFACQDFNLREQSHIEGATTTGTVYVTITPSNISVVPTTTPTLTPTRAPSTVSPTTSLPVYYELYNTTSCDGQNAEHSGTIQSGSCFVLIGGESQTYSTITCHSAAADSAWTVNTYADSMCSGAVVQSGYGSGACTCIDAHIGTVSSGMYINCAGVYENCNDITSASHGGSSGLSKTSQYIILGVLVGLAAIGIMVFNYYALTGQIKCRKPLADAPETEMRSEL